VQGSTATTAPTTAAAASPTINAEAQTAAATVEVANATAMPACVVRPEVTEGPYYVNEDLNRSDIRSDPSSGAVKEGIPLALTFKVSQVTSSGCAALPGAKVEIWHCDAAGIYSDVSDPGFNTKGQQFLRGYQVTDANGNAAFTTIYPGWYRGRAVHIHFKVHPDANTVFTSQLFFDDALSDQVFTQAPYASKGQRDTLNSNDNIYNPQLLVTTSQSGQGYAATFDIGIQKA
jgi:protocatechuate 3,4-dioxygenase beta subunit